MGQITDTLSPGHNCYFGVWVGYRLGIRIYIYISEYIYIYSLWVFLVIGHGVYPEVIYGSITLAVPCCHFSQSSRRPVVLSLNSSSTNHLFRSESNHAISPLSVNMDHIFISFSVCFAIIGKFSKSGPSAKQIS